MTKKIMNRKTNLTIIFITLLSLLACNPSAYKKPVSDFRQGMHDTKKAYTENLNLTEKSYVDWKKATTYLAARDFGWNKKMEQDLLEAATKKYKFDPNSVKAREKSFQAMFMYTDVLLALASGDDTNELVTEITGLSKDIQKFLKYIDEIEATKDLTKYIEGLSLYVKAATIVIEIISEAVREAAIRKTIIANGEPIQKLLIALSEEAEDHQETTRRQYENIVKHYDTAINNYPVIKDPSKEKAKDVIYRNQAIEEKLKWAAISKKLNESIEIDDLFNEAMNAHLALVTKASNIPTAEELYLSIKSFRSKVDEFRQTVDEIKELK